MADQNQNIFNFVNNNSKKVQLTEKEKEIIKSLEESSTSNVNFLNEVNKDSVEQQGSPFVLPSPRSIDEDLVVRPEKETFDEKIPDDEPSVEGGTNQPTSKPKEGSMDDLADKLGPIQSRFSSAQNQVPVEKIQEIKERDASKFNLDAAKELDRAEGIIDEKLAQTNELPSSSLQSNSLADDLPVDIDYASDGSISPFYNVQKALRYRGLGFLADKVNVDAQFFQSPFFNNRAKKLYADYLKKKGMSEKELKKRKLMSILKLSIIPLVIIGLLLGRLILRVNPARQATEAHQALAAGNYAVAEELFCEKLQDGPHCAFTRAMHYQADGNYEKAYEYLDKLTDYQNSLNYNLDEARNEFKYRQAISLLDKKEYTEGLNILREISNYKDAANIFYSTCYNLAQTYEPTNEEVALRYYYMARKYEDAEVKFSNLAQVYYDEAVDLYNRKNYVDAKSDFAVLRQYRFKDSELMYNQCDYASALALYRAGSFAESNEIFSTLKDFKDSRALIVDLTKLDEDPEEIRQNDLFAVIKAETSEMESKACDPFIERIESILATRTDFFTSSIEIIPENENGNVKVVLKTGEEIILSIPTIEKINNETLPTVESILANYIFEHASDYGLEFSCSPTSPTEESAETEQTTEEATSEESSETSESAEGGE